MEFKYDLFISYSGHDNKPLANEKGWVTNFSRFLDTALERLLKRRPRILLSHDLDSSALAKTSPVEILSKTAAFINIISPEYIKSKNFQETEDFISSAQYSGGLEIGDLPRIYKVIKNPLSANQQPASLQKFWSYELFETDKSGNAKEFSNFFDLKAETEYWLLLVDLAYDIRNLIYAADLDVKKEDKFSGKTVYLSELGDYSKYRNILKRELQKHGYKVVPDKPLESAQQNYKSEVNNYLNNSALSVHLITDDMLQHNADQMIAKAQDTFTSEFIDGAKARGGEKNFPKLVWFSPDLKANTEEQKLKIEKLKKDIEAVNGAEIIQTPLEVFKTIVHDRARQQFNKKVSRVKSGVKSVYVVHSFADKNNVEPAIRTIKNQGLEVLTPLFEGDILNIVETHRQNLVDCDAVFVYYGSKDTDQWLKSKLIDLQKAPGFGRSKPMLAQSIFFEKQSKQEKAIDKYNLMLISNNGALSTESLTPFINKIR